MNRNTIETAESQDLKQKKSLCSNDLFETDCGVLRCVSDGEQPTPKKIRDFVDAVKHCANNDPKIIARKEFEANGKSSHYDELKRKIPAWVLGGAGGKTNATITPNGFIALDVDHISNNGAKSVKEILCKLPFIGLSCLSLSGNGVFALIYAPAYVGNPEKIKGEIYDTIDVYLKAKLAAEYKQSIKFEIDLQCTDIARKRVESFDPGIFVSNDIKPYEQTDTLIDGAWNDSKTKQLALMLGYDAIQPNHASVGAILALAAASGRLSIWDRSIFDETKVYQARVGAVILGRSGKGKGELIDNISEIAQDLHITISNYKSTAAMAFGVSKSCNTQEPDETNPKQFVWKPKQLKDIHPIIEINDEDYAARKVAKQTAYSMDKLAERRKILDRRYEPQSTKRDSLPDYAFTAAYQYLCLSQFESFADAIRGERTDTGDGRRELILELPDDETNDGEHFADTMFKSDMNSKRADVEGIIHALKDAYQNHIDPYFEQTTQTILTDKLASAARQPDFYAMTWHNLTNCQFTFMRCLKTISANDAEWMDAKTHLVNIAAIECYLSGRREMTPRDLLAAAAITRESFGMRRRLFDRSDELELAENGDKVTKWLETYWHKPGKCVAIQNYTKAKINNGISRRQNNEIVTQWETHNLIEFYEGNNKRVRRGTEAELTEQLKEIDISDKISQQAGGALNELVTKWDATHDRSEQYSQSWRRPTFADDTTDAQRIRVFEMIKRCIDGNRCGQFVQGQRQSTLYRISNVLMQNGMWGQVAKDILFELGKGAGLPDREIKHALRDSR